MPLSNNREEPSNSTKHLKNTFTVAPQSAPPRQIQSLQLYRLDQPSSPPVIELGSRQQLVLKFDHLGSDARQFKIEVRHYSADWQESPLALNYYLDGFYEDYFGAGSKSYVQRPAYRHYEYVLPNDRLSMTVSGNYLLTVREPDSGNLLFSLPFFVSEQEGELQTSIKTEYARREDLREQDRPFSEYRYPPFVEMPQFDLSFQYVQNQFWGRARPVKHFDTSTPGSVHFHLSQQEAFLGDYEFNTLDIRSFTPDGTHILSYEPEFTPPNIILRRDVQQFTPAPAFWGGPRLGRPDDDRSAEYANVHFRLETAAEADALQQIYLVGDFNGWTINPLNRMKFNPGSGLWEGSAFIKQGEYAYKYVTLEENRINDLELDRSFTYRRQEYITLVYYRDPVRHYDRLLNVASTEY
ncbi:type IX secretion system plug protein domain-containing protein [Halalkalibaculum sp. DA3122]|uniref:type IX secretion system plug protein n=1 Tax=Halalkalibaculum sp. DA3122 TaxID=3373607 RepID=UPI0037542597